MPLSDMEKKTLEDVADELCDSKGWTRGVFLGEGSYKVVYRVEMEGSQVGALKLLNSGASEQRTEREIDAMRKCNHPQIASLLEVGEYVRPSQCRFKYMVEEFFGGGTLDDRWDAGDMDAADAVALALSLVSPLAHLRSLRLVHRDVKPANIMYREGGDAPVLGDLGLVRFLGRESLTASFMPKGLGTPYYMAPEQWRNDKALTDWRADQFSVGVMLTQLVTGWHPYQDCDPLDDGATIHRLMNYLDPCSLPLGMLRNQGLDSIIPMVLPRPHQRYRKPEDLERAMRGIQGA